ncbi:carboxypeptidase regulatory-like domain-containing protein [Candidatus Dependentiae bacterium]|nr:carboxypeptidase regulatory-like domain-containing protein [Candidatus Dependentiae bacterium]
MRLSVLICLLAAAMLILSGCGKGVIVGKVIDENNDPVAGAQIVTDPPTYSKLSTVDGYEMKNIPSGVYTVTVNKSGYSKKDIEIKVFNKRTTQADVQIKKLNK